jgi:hypothetical protein
MEITLTNLGTKNKNILFLANNNKRITLYFSYQTLIAFDYQDEKIYEKQCSLNKWSNTTGRFINEIQPDANKLEPNELVVKRAEYLMGEMFKN